jgi:hypothetical protein
MRIISKVTTSGESACLGKICPIPPPLLHKATQKVISILVVLLGGCSKTIQKLDPSVAKKYEGFTMEKRVAVKLLSGFGAIQRRNSAAWMP